MVYQVVKLTQKMKNRIGFMEGGNKKVANRTSHRYDYLPLLPSGPGGVQQELVVPICRCETNKKRLIQATITVILINKC